MQALGPSPSCSYRTWQPSLSGRTPLNGAGVGRAGRRQGGGECGGGSRSGGRAWPVCHGLPPRLSGAGGNRGGRDDEEFGELPTKFELSQRPDKQKPLVKVRLSVHYRVHSRQILCIGGSQIPMGWSFLSIAKVPMTWNAGDIWTCEVRLGPGCAPWPGLGDAYANAVTDGLCDAQTQGNAHITYARCLLQVELQAGQRIEHKYVILEEQVSAPSRLTDVAAERACAAASHIVRTGTCLLWCCVRWQTPAFLIHSVSLWHDARGVQGRSMGCLRSGCGGWELGFTWVG